ncbi:MAG: hypothetical protein K9J83_06070 [Desulfarculaceae bacterium]|nr:hypothetical protein [Desulfarculaceae bacterium]
MTVGNMEKRIKRRVTARDHTFFCVCSPGTGNICRKELSCLGIDPSGISVTKGGVEFTGKVYDCYLANLYLRSPVRILMRICGFRAESFAELEKKASNVDWELYVPSDAAVEYSVSCSKSRLYHTGAVEERLVGIVSKKAEKDGISSADSAEGRPLVKLYVRAENDRFEISIDSSGDLLFKRGVKEMAGKAPIRENLAFALLQRAGFSPEDILADPMCGSGTFSLEAAMIKKRIPPGYFRGFAFENWPCFRPAQLAHIRKKAAEQFAKAKEKSVFAFDIDDRALDFFENRMNACGLHDFIRIEKKDFFDLTAADFPNKGLLVLNPPYGKRMGSRDETRAFFQEIFEKLGADFKGWRTGIVIPDRSLAELSGFKCRISPFFHGGLDVFALTGKV